MRNFLGVVCVCIVCMFACSCACQKIVKVDYSAEEFYARMMTIEEGKVSVFKTFPKTLQPMLNFYQGTIFETDSAILQLVYRYPDSDTDRKIQYPFYFIRDNHGNYWTLFKSSGDTYRLCRENSKEARSYFKSKQQELDSKD